MQNIGNGMPLFRIEDDYARDGVPIDRGTLSRWKKTVGDSFSETVVETGGNTRALSPETTVSNPG